jgi:hypothetical protein
MSYVSLLLSLSMLSQTAEKPRIGDVCTLPDGLKLVVPGKLNWAVQDPTFDIPRGTRAIVVRIEPKDVTGVAEVKVYDGTDRLGWLETSSLTTIKSTMVFAVPNARLNARLDPPKITALSNGSSSSTDPIKPYGVRVTSRRRARKLPDFSQVDAAIAGMGFNATSGFGSFGGGYYSGPRQPPGQYVGGTGSSHKGGHYMNPATNNHYQHR